MGKCSRTPGSKKYFIAGLANGPDMGYIYQTGEETPPHGGKAGLTYQARRPGWKGGSPVARIKPICKEL